MKLSDRLQAIAGFIPMNTIVADIGTDHGYIPVYLMENNIAKRVIATDISSNSLAKIKGYVKETSHEEDIDIRLGDGLSPLLPFEVDTVVIAGMGGLLIRDILDGNKEKRDSITHFILQANVASRELRKYLDENNFEIIDEKLVREEERFYEIIWAKKGKDYIEKDIHYEIGQKLLDNRDPLIKEFINYKIGMKKDIIKELEGNESQRVMDRRNELMENINELRMVLDGLEGDGNY